MLTIIGRLVLAPLPFVVFADFWVSEQLKNLIVQDYQHAHFVLKRWQISLIHWPRLSRTFTILSVSTQIIKQHSVMDGTLPWTQRQQRSCQSKNRYMFAVVRFAMSPGGGCPTSLSASQLTLDWRSASEGIYFGFMFLFLQYLRYRDTRSAWPHLVNAGKYSSGMIANLFRYGWKITLNLRISHLQLAEPRSGPHRPVLHLACLKTNLHCLHNLLGP